MVKFKRVRWKNFLSGGNTFTEIDINVNGGLTLITSEENGAGKSTLIESLCFGLFNKSFRGVSKRALLVNSINKKNCVVEVEFDVGSDSYKVVRGIAPNVFEIYKNGTLLNQLSKELDYQRVLEENILDMNYKSFTQIVILGSSNFTPFLELTTANRREVVNTILDLDVIGLMQNELKDEYKTIQDDLSDYEHKMEILKNKYINSNNVIKKLNKTKEEATLKNQDEIKIIEEDNNQLKSSIEELNTKREQYILDELEKQHKEVSKTLKDYENEILLLKNENKNIKKELTFYDKNDICPTCTQVLDEEFVRVRKAELVNQATGNIGVIEERNNIIKDIKDTINNIKETKNVYKEITDEIRSLEHKIENNLSTIERLIRMQDTTSIDEDINKEREVLKEIQKDGVDIKNRVDSLKDKIEVFEFAMVLMKDTGFKTMVIKEYLPVINQLINMYLKKLDSYFYFEFDENFDDTVLARHVDELQYASLSGGERIRLTLAILFTWRYICIKKNTANCNLLILDEIFSESLDRDGVDATIKLLRELGDTHTFILSPNSDVIRPKFNDIIEVSKPADFSVYTRVTQ